MVMDGLSEFLGYFCKGKNSAIYIRGTWDEQLRNAVSGIQISNARRHHPTPPSGHLGDRRE